MGIPANDAWREDNGIALDAALTDEQNQQLLDDRGITEAEADAEVVAFVVAEIHQEMNQIPSFYTWDTIIQEEENGSR